ncbi:unnamed protein product [Ambrosiozyma monospora]|uniref:Unnamed protein product n=1 Tax=Ambrosiozyma monospora TaxID=43982 RepID=A0A9W6YR43_AMBMO|nr:unnamed protein product [Ambrosiozyma monospora]
MSSNMQENQNNLRTSDFPPKVYDYKDHKTSVLHYNLWRVFVDRQQQQSDQQEQQSDQQDQQQSDQEQQQSDQQQQQSEQQPSTGNKDGYEPLQSQWEQSAFPTREKEYPGCTVTIADFNETRYRLERRTIYTEDAHGKFSQICDCDPNEITKDVFLAKLEESKVGLVEALRQKPGWSKLRWVNVNGIEKSTLFSIIRKFELDIEATSYMFTSLDNCNVDTYDNGQLFCELSVLHCFENVSNIEQSESPLDREEKTVEKLHRLFPNVTTYLKEKSKMKLFDPDEEHRDLTAGTKLLKKQENFEKSKLLKTLNYSIAIERGWLFITDSGTVISFFENTGEEVEERVFFDFFRRLELKDKMKTDEFTCLENILSAFLYDMTPLVTLYQNLLYKFKVDLNTDASTRRLHRLYLMIDDLSALKLRLDRLAKMVNLLLDNFPSMPPDCKRYMLNLKETLEELTGETREMMESIKNLIDLTFNRVSASTSKYMSLLAFVSMVFLPMSFFTSYFGMNYFQKLHHVGVFWTISSVITVAIICGIRFIFSLDSPDILNMLHKLASNSYSYLREKTAEFKRKRGMINQRHQDNATTYSATTQNESPEIDAEAKASTGETTRYATSSSSRQRNSNSVENSNLNVDIDNQTGKNIGMSPEQMV